MKRTALIAVIMVVALFGVAVYANADAAGPYSTTVSANVKAKVLLTVPATVTLQTAALGPIAPGEDGLGTAALVYSTNKDATLTAVSTPNQFATLSSTAVAAGATGLAAPKGGAVGINDSIIGTVDWSDTGDTTVSGSIAYTLTQN